MRVFESARHRRTFVAVAGVALLSVAGLYLLVGQYLPFLMDGAELRAFVDGYGAFAPLVFIGLQAGQVMLAPIPGQLTGFVSGYLFGGFLGTVYSLVGVPSAARSSSGCPDGTAGPSSSGCCGPR